MTKFNTSKLTKCKLDRTLGTKQYFRSYAFLLFRSYDHFYFFIRSPGFLFIRSSGFGQLDQLGESSTLKISSNKVSFRKNNLPSTMHPISFFGPANGIFLREQIFRNFSSFFMLNLHHINSKSFF